MDKLDFLSGETPADVTAPAESIEQHDGPARGPDGKFVSQQIADPAPEPEPAPAPVAEVVAPPPAPPAPEPGHVPLSAMLDEREKRQKLEQQLADYQRQLSQHQSQQQAPDPFVDPGAYTQAAVNNVKFDLSEEMARGTHGDDLVDQARDWAVAKARSSPGFNQELQTARHPYDFAVKAFQRDQFVSQVKPSEFEQFRAWQAAQAAVQANPLAAQAAPPQPVAAPPRSLASATSAGGAVHVPTGEGQAFDSLFKR